MRRLVLASAISLAIASTALAQSRPDSRALSCDEVQGLIAGNGAVVLTTGEVTFDRYVASRQFCSHPNVPVLTYIASRDTNQCPVYRCGDAQFPFDD